ncbi:uncharacterized protein K441DRAFT_164226 [Cenococcum geophilum 1.58]|uniref:uncharacterized protein n=1 Tax=Cenococcum geophilum 1.58 TaxID=794803 RepID=UPI00358EBC98|nr:hypothetical protein K441DRAFT_164226 [Cenococcum geophilum 1.58]
MQPLQQHMLQTAMLDTYLHYPPYSLSNTQFGVLITSLRPSISTILPITPISLPQLAELRTQRTWYF